MLTRLWNWFAESIVARQRNTIPGEGPIAPVEAEAREHQQSRAVPEQRSSHELLHVSAMVALLRRLQAPEVSTLFALRGSLPLLAWGGELARTPDDIDLVLLAGNSPARGHEALQHALLRSNADGYRFEIVNEVDLWNYTAAPGVRYSVVWQTANQRNWLDFDVAEGEHLPLAPEWMQLSFPDIQQEVTALCCTPELSLAWKLRWLLVDTPWDLDDLYDALLLFRLVKLDSAKLRAAVLDLFRLHETPIAELYRYLDRSLLHNGWRGSWRHVPQRLRTLMPSQEAAFTGIAERLTTVLDGQLGLPRAPELPFFQAALATPADASARLVYADWLEEQDDPRAELVRLDSELSTTAAGNSEQRARHAALLAQANAARPGWAARVCRWVAPQE